MTMPLEDLARHIEGLLDGKVVHRHIALAELTVVVVPDQIVPVLAATARRLAMPVRAADRHLRRRLPRARQALRRGLSPAFAAPQSAHPHQVRDGCRHAVPSVIDVFPAANWYEREAYDMYGILFLRPPRPAPHPHRLRLPGLSPAQGLPPHRLRRGALRRRPEARRLRAVKLTQEFRSFDFESPWEASDYVLPGDEKAKG
jgi:NADH-quinone oxidoreductase subunit C